MAARAALPTEFAVAEKHKARLLPSELEDNCNNFTRATHELGVSQTVRQLMAGTERLPVSAQTLRHRLREHGLLASIDAGRQMVMVRRTLEGSPRQVLHLKASDLVGRED